MEVDNYTNTKSIQFILNYLSNFKQSPLLRLYLKDVSGIFDLDELLKAPHYIETLALDINF
jgi:hypothetical protein